MPYFHVWFELDGGIGHVVEEPDRWPKGDLFAREIVGGMLGAEPDLIKKAGQVADEVMIRGSMLSERSGGSSTGQGF